MQARFILTDYIDNALKSAAYDKLKDGTFIGRVPACAGVVAAAPSLAQCQVELRSVFEGWLLQELKLGHRLPVLGGINLDRDPHHGRAASA